MSVLSDKIRAVRCPRASAVIVAAGSGTRFGGDKLLELLGGVPVLLHSLRAFEAAELVDEIVLVTRPDRVEELSSRCAGWDLRKLKTVVPGGKTRTESCFAGVMAASNRSGIVAIHDGARPLVTPELIDAVIWDAHCHSAAIPAVPVRDTVKLAADHVVKSTPDRSTLYAVQTPQCFQRDLIRAALLSAYQSGAGVTDDASAVEQAGGAVWLTAGSEENIKITTPLDLALAEIILQRRNAACASDTDTTPID